MPKFMSFRFSVASESLFTSACKSHHHHAVTHQRYESHSVFLLTLAWWKKDRNFTVNGFSLYLNVCSTRPRSNKFQVSDCSHSKSTTMKRNNKDMGPVHSFLTRLTLKTAIAVFQVCSFLKAFPFALESRNSLKVQKYTAKWRLVLWHVVNFIVYCAATFQFTTYMYELWTSVRGNAFAIHTMYVMYSVFGVVFMLSVYMKPDVCILMLNQHDRLLQIIDRKSD